MVKHPPHCDNDVVKHPPHCENDVVISSFFVLVAPYVHEMTSKYVPRSNYVVFVVCVFHHSIHQLTLSRDTAYDNLFPKSLNVTSSAPTENKIHYAKLCREEVSCNSFFYNDVSRKCLRQRVVHMAPPPNDALLEAGWQYFRLGQVNNSFGQPRTK